MWAIYYLCIALFSYYAGFFQIQLRSEFTFQNIEDPILSQFNELDKEWNRRSESHSVVQFKIQNEDCLIVS